MKFKFNNFEFTFTKLEGRKDYFKGTPKKYKDGVKINKNSILMYAKELKGYKRVDLLVDRENNAIKIVEGDYYKVIIGKTEDSPYRAIPSNRVLKMGFKEGFYKRVEDNVYVLQD